MGSAFFISGLMHIFDETLGTMKSRIFGGIAAIVILASSLAGCNSGRPLTFDGSKYSPEIQFIDSLRYNVGEPEYSASDIPEDSLLRAWVGFAERFSASDYPGAYDFTLEDNNFSKILIYLKNSTAQYVFISSAWSEVIFQVKASEDFYQEMDQLLNLNLALVKASVNEGFVPPHYTDLLRSMGMIYRLSGNWEIADTFCDEIYQGYMASGYGDVTSRLAVQYYMVQFMNDYGMSEQALDEVRALKDVVEKQCSEVELPSALEIIKQMEEMIYGKLNGD